MFERWLDVYFFLLEKVPNLPAGRQAGKQGFRRFA
jgi:hypothetical protein